jgi:hypothetical protein
VSEVADSRARERETGEDQDARGDPVDEATLQDGQRHRQQVIQSETEQKSGEKEKRRSRDDAGRFGILHDNLGVILAI